MSAYISDGWRPRNDRDTRFTNQDDKNVKAFVGVILLVILGFVLAELQPAAHNDSQNIQTTAQRIVRPAN